MNAVEHDLAPERIARLLTTRRLGRPYLYFARIGSTNDEARRRAEAGAPEGLVLVADEQAAGRGRLDRRWWAPPGSSLLMSLLLRPGLPLARAGQLTMCLGLGAVEGVAEVTGLAPRLKWPNDLALNGRKLGGMLSEVQAHAVGDRLEYPSLAWA
jgi:BirA family biotin operon repressor/biotin-[acetyl-CoA-carboxylase] ligase